MKGSPDRLYELLPVVHRMRDAERGHALRALLRVVTEQADVVEDDIQRLYENWFIETCEDWVVPYIGDLVGYRPVFDAGQPGDVRTARDRIRNKILIPRRDVANTIPYRRRKGTLALLEELAMSVAGWPSRAVEFYTLLAWTQHLNHQRLMRGRTVDLRNGDALDRLGGPFDEIAHTVDVRRVNSQRTQGRCNIPSVGLFVWRLKSYSVKQAPADCLEGEGAHCFTFSVLGNDAPLYAKGEREEKPTHIAEEMNVQAPIRPHALEERIFEDRRVIRTQASSTYYGAGKSLVIWTKGWPQQPGHPAEDYPKLKPIPRELVIPANLDGWGYDAPDGRVLVDSERGRIVFPVEDVPENVYVSYHYGFSADIGGGEYTRQIPQVSLTAISHFHQRDFTNLSVLVKKLRRDQDQPQDAMSQAVSGYIAGRLSSETQALLSLYDGHSTPSARLQPLLRMEFDRLLADEDFYSDQRFTTPLTDDIKTLLNEVPRLPHLACLNRLLLEFAYPQEIAKSYAFYPVRGGEREDEEVQEPLREALNQWATEKPRHAIIELQDSKVYVGRVHIDLLPGQTLQIRAAQHQRPVVRLLDWRTNRPDPLKVHGGEGSRFVLDGLLITGRGVQVSGTRRREEGNQPPQMEGDLCEVVIRHSTLVPGWGLLCDCEPEKPNEPSLELINSRAHITVEHSILGSIYVTADEVRTEPVKISISDSIVDATDEQRVAIGSSGRKGRLLGHATLTIARCTLIGTVEVHAIDLAENSIFVSPVSVGRRQQGCMRFCYLPPEKSRTPRRYECQPDLVERPIREEHAITDVERNRRIEQARLRVVPQFNSWRYGVPTYCQLALACATEITKGGDDEAEMGVFHDLYQPPRLANLRARLDEYTPAGMDAGIIIAS